MISGDFRDRAVRVYGQLDGFLWTSRVPYQSGKLHTVFGPQQYSSLHHTEWAYLMAACTLFTLPVLVVFFFTQRSFILGISFKGVKG